MNKRYLLLIILFSLAFFFIGRFSATNPYYQSSKTKDKSGQAEQNSNNIFPERTLNLTYFNPENVVWGSATHHKEFEDGDIRQYSQVALDNEAVYQSYPTTEVSLSGYDDSVRKIKTTSLSEAIEKIKDHCPMKWPVETTRENYQKHGAFITHFLPIYEIYKVDHFDVDDDDKDETIVYKNLNCRATGGSTTADIIKNNQIIFSTTADDSTILPAETSNGFNVEWRPSKWGTPRCCPEGFIRTRFVFREGTFTPIYEQQVGYLKVREK